MQTTKGSLFLLIGPSGVGKTTIAKALIANKTCSNLKVIPSYTTRQQRPEEKNGVDYHFISCADFDQKLATGFFIETSIAYHASYGSSKYDVLQALLAGFDVLLVVDRNGARSIKKEFPEVIIINIVPKSIEVLHQRLLARAQTVTPEITKEIQFRLKKAREEFTDEQREHLAQYAIVNDDLEQAIKQIELVVCGKKG